MGIREFPQLGRELRQSLVPPIVVTVVPAWHGALNGGHEYDADDGCAQTLEELTRSVGRLL
jgi:hypothetical protein